MHMVDIADDRPGLCRKVLRGLAAKVLRRNNAPVNVVHAGGDITAGHELGPALGNFDGTNLTRPVMDILKKVPVNGLEMDEVEVAGRDAFSRALQGQPPLDLFEHGGVTNVEFISEDRCPRIDVGVQSSLNSSVKLVLPMMISLPHF